MCPELESSCSGLMKEFCPQSIYNKHYTIIWHTNHRCNNSYHDIQRFDEYQNGWWREMMSCISSKFWYGISIYRKELNYKTPSKILWALNLEHTAYPAHARVEADDTSLYAQIIPWNTYLYNVIYLKETFHL